MYTLVILIKWVFETQWTGSYKVRSVSKILYKLVIVMFEFSPLKYMSDHIWLWLISSCLIWNICWQEYIMLNKGYVFIFNQVIWPSLIERPGGRTWVKCDIGYNLTLSSSCTLLTLWLNCYCFICIDGKKHAIICLHKLRDLTRFFAFIRPCWVLMC